MLWSSQLGAAHQHPATGCNVMLQFRKGCVQQASSPPTVGAVTSISASVGLLASACGSGGVLRWGEAQVGGRGWVGGGLYGSCGWVDTTVCATWRLHLRNRCGMRLPVHVPTHASRDGVVKGASLEGTLWLPSSATATVWTTYVVAGARPVTAQVSVVQVRRTHAAAGPRTGHTVSWYRAQGEPLGGRAWGGFSWMRALTGLVGVPWLDGASGAAVTICRAGRGGGESVLSQSAVRHTRLISCQSEGVPRCPHACRLTDRPRPPPA